MVDWEDFENMVFTQLNRDIREESNQNQNEIIRAPLNQSLFIVAGPGSGKTTAIALRVLKLIFVDEVEPSNILVTTFTHKAADELRSRILGWGDQLRRAFMNNFHNNHIQEQMNELDLTRIITGTIDRIIEDTLLDYRSSRIQPPVIIENFVSDALMIRFGLFNHRRDQNDDLKQYIKYLQGQGLINIKSIRSILKEIHERFYHDQIQINQFRDNSRDPGIQLACDAICDYHNELESRFLFDFPSLEQYFLDRLSEGTLDRFLQNIRFILVDEYQDTNLLQEQIYFLITEAALTNGGSIAVVGDDDQSIFRFRGATVDLFQSFYNRINERLNINPRTIFLNQNYRSVPFIVNFFNEFITLDQEYQNARVQEKPNIIPSRSQPYTDYPVLGMFRDNVEQLARNLSNFIHRIVYGEGFVITDYRGEQYTISISQEGSPSDIAILFHSPQEFDYRQRPKLPHLLRDRLMNLNPPIYIFNPRGRNLETIHEVQILCGLILECIDPGNRVQNTLNIPHETIERFNNWRISARRYINTNPEPNATITLGGFVNAWQTRNPMRNRNLEGEISLIDLVYKIVTWIPYMQNDIEGLVYLETITRTIDQVTLFGRFVGRIIINQNNSRREQSSIREALREVFAPIASGGIEVKEELFETLPPNRLNIMSIHQAKGLEFPLVIVDVGSDIRNLQSPKFKRFPSDEGKTCRMEDEMRLYSPLGRLERYALDRAFDDLTRLYFEAYSRAQDILMLVGLNSIRNGYLTPRKREPRQIPHIATGWDRNGNWHWNQGLNNLIHIEEVD